MSYAVELQLDSVDFHLNIASDVIKGVSHGFYPPFTSSHHRPMASLN